MLQRNKVAIIVGIIAKLALISLNPATNPPHPPAPTHPHLGKFISHQIWNISLEDMPGA